MAPRTPQGMEGTVLNPLFDMSVKNTHAERTAAPAAREQAQQQSGKEKGSRSCTQCRRSFFRGTPWLIVLGVIVLAAGLITWSVFTDRFVAAALQFLNKADVLPPGDVAHALGILKAVLTGVTSVLGAFMLLLGITFKKQQLEKKAAASPADWPHGRKSHATTGLSTTLALLLWLVAAGFVGLLCATFAATGASLVGELAAGHALTLADNLPNLSDSSRVQALQTSLKNARSAFKTASEKAPPFITRSPWFKGLTSSMNPHLSKDAGNSSAAAQAAAEAVCPENCLNLNALTAFLNKRSATASACLCVRASVEEAQQLLGRMWRAGLGGLASTAALAITATWLLVYCVVACVTTWRDNRESNTFRQWVQQGNGGDGINRWMWTAGVATPHSPSETMSSFPAFEAPDSHVKRPQQLLAPEMTTSTLSPSPRKQAKWHDDQHMQPRAGDYQADDIERPAQLPPDQLPVMPSAQQHQAGTAPPAGLSRGQAASQQAAPAAAAAAGRGSARMPPSTSNASSYRRKWDNSGPR